MRSLLVSFDLDPTSFQLVAAVREFTATARTAQHSSCAMKRHGDAANTDDAKRLRDDTLSDEALARQLHEELNGPMASPAAAAAAPAASHALVARDGLGFCLTRVPGLSASANACSVGLRDLFAGPSPCESIVACNYMVDMDFLADTVDVFGKVPTLVVHGEKGDRVTEMERVVQRRRLSGVRLHAPSLPIPFGTHHTKCFLIFFQDTLRVCVHTANLIPQVGALALALLRRYDWTHCNTLRGAGLGAQEPGRVVA